ncbi:MAG: HAMP domain-containing sensor histidine kinase [Bacteroidota bacterium]
MLLAPVIPVVVLLIVGLFCIEAYLAFLTVVLLQPNLVLPSQPAPLQADRKGTAWLDNVNHEIRTPLAGILATAQILHDEVGPQHQELTELLMESGQRMNNAICDVIDLVALTEPSYKPDQIPVRINQELPALIDRYSAAAMARGISIEFDPMQKDYAVKSDPALLRKVFEHLLQNAIQFTDAGAIKLAVKKDGEWLHVEIKDASPVMAKNLLYRQHNPSLLPESKQTPTAVADGLGLALTKRMINISGGRISVSHQAGNSNTLTVSYPVAEESA